MKELKKLTVLIPCYNEEKGVAKVIKAVPVEKLRKIGYSTEILVVDNNSKDNTSKVAKEAGARVVFEGKQGKRYALEKGFTVAKGDLIAMLDGDNTYPAEEIYHLVKEINGADLVTGTRFYSIWKLSKLFYPKELGFHRVLANKIGAEMGSLILGKRFTDATTGMRVFKKSLLKKIPKIKAKNLDFECEFTARVITAGFNYKEVMIKTNFREGSSSLNYFTDAFRFLWAMIRGRWF
jgi:glycosyltransferase involved in cell wall biosynthesis